MKDRYSKAHIYLDSNITESKQEMWKNPKIVIAGMTKQIEACYVETPLAIVVFTNLRDMYITTITVMLESLLASHPTLPQILCCQTECLRFPET